MNEKNIPIHIAIIMDGNGRWAKKKLMPRAFGHVNGVKTVKKILKEADKIGIKYLTLYAFSTENWKRPGKEVNALMKLFKEYLIKERKELDENNVILTFSGRREGITQDLLNLMDETKKFLSKNTGITLNIAFNYGSRAEIVDAINNLLKDEIKEVNEEIISKYLYNSNIPDPELLIRTSGEMRISNFLLWQIAYSEIYVTDTLWPDFNEENLHQAIEEYQKRDRRFGGVIK